MRTVDQALQWAQLIAWVLLAAAATRLWQRRRDGASAWLATTFASLAFVVVTGRLLPQDGPAPELDITLKMLIAVIVLFPYLLYRFVVSLLGKGRAEWVAVHGVTGIVVVWTLLLPPASDLEQRPPMLQAYVICLVAQWVSVLGWSSWRLWRAGSGQPSVSRKRVRMMGLGAVTLATVLLLMAFAPQTDEPAARDLVVQGLALLAGPFFIFGFLPPRVLRVLWRTGEEAALRETEAGLVQALSRAEVADALLPRVMGLLGGRSAALLDAERETLGARGLGEYEIEWLAAALTADAAKYEPVATGQAWVIRLENGWLIVNVGPLTPFFGADEIQMLSALAVLTDLALGRAKLFELEKQARDAMREFVAIASHDLRTPVTVIQGFAQTMTQNWDAIEEDKKKTFMEAIERQIKHLDRLIRDLLTVSKIDVQEMEVAARPTDVLRSAQEAVEAMGSDAAIQVTGNGRAIALADPEHLDRMLNNYVKNALVYGAPPYSLEVTREDGWVVVRLRDQGQGIPEGFVPQLFGKFSRVDKKKSKAVQGTGLGLSIVRGLARANGGDAWYERNEPCGACFVLKLPAVGSPSRGGTG